MQDRVDTSYRETASHDGLWQLSRKMIKVAKDFNKPKSLNDQE